MGGKVTAEQAAKVLLDNANNALLGHAIAEAMVVMKANADELVRLPQDVQFSAMFALVLNIISGQS